MKLKFRTRVKSSADSVWQAFDRELFLKLAPPLPRIKLLRFDGCTKGDRVEIELNFLLFRQMWCSEIIEQKVKPDEIYFVDEGFQLPFFLRRWNHRHRIVRHESGSEIIDEITYRSPYLLLEWLIYPVMWLQFAYRKPIYRRVFRNRT